MEFQEFLEVHKAKSSKSAWANDIVLPTSEKHQHKKDKSARQSDVEQQTAVDTTSSSKVDQKKKLSDLEARNSWRFSLCAF